MRDFIAESERRRTIQGVSMREYQHIHYWLKKSFGKANHCEGDACKGECTVFQWAKISGAKYEKNRENFIQLCASCHSIYDCTDEKRQKISRAQTGIKRSEEFKRNVSLHSRGRKMPESAKTKIGLALGRAVIQLDEEGNQLREWPSQSDAARAFGVHHSAINQASSPDCLHFHTKCLMDYLKDRLPPA